LEAHGLMQSQHSLPWPFYPRPRNLISSYWAVSCR